MDEVASAIAVVGVYFALMAVLAVIVEAVISWFKIPIPWLQGKPSPSDVFNEVKDWLPEGEGDENTKERLEARIAALNKALGAIGEVKLGANENAAKLAETVGTATTKHIQKERTRRGVIRLIAIALGIGFAVLFQIDTLDLLAPLTAPAQKAWKDALGEGGMHVVGLVLSGLAASAGSSFWHDQSARLRQFKVASEAASELGS